LLIAGYMTHNCIDSTAREAFHPSPVPVKAEGRCLWMTVSPFAGARPSMGAAPGESGAKIGALAGARCNTWITATPERSA